MRRISIIILAFIAIMAQAQKVTFNSEGIEAGVRHHLGLDVNSDILQSQTDTITAIDLSGLGITDLRDIVYLPNLKTLDLSDNEITNVGPLNVLDSLRDLSLRENNLESVNLLAFSNAEKMMVDVTANYIGDFSYLFDCIKCQFTLIGMGRQKVKDAPYFDVCQLYADVDDEGQPIVWYRGFTNMTETPLMTCGDAQTAATIDGHLNSMTVPGSPTAATAVVLACGELTDTTYVVPPQYIDPDGEAALTLATGLPEGYTIGSAYAKYGTVEVDGTTMTYTVAGEDDDIVQFSYYESGQLRGISRFFIQSRMLLGDANNDKVVNVTDVMLIVNNILGRALPVFNRKNADVNKDNHISVADVMSVVKIVLSNPSHAPASARLDLENRMLVAANSSGCDIRLEGNAPFTACEMVLSLPEGCTLLDATLDNHQPVSHQIMVNSLSDGRHKVVIYAPANGQLVLNEGPMVNLKLSGKADGIKVSDIMCCNHRYETVELQDAVGMTTDLKDALSAGAENDTYSIQGIKTPKPKRGVFIKNRKKTVVK